MENLRQKWKLLKKYTLVKDKFIDVERCIYENPLSKEKKNEDYSIVNFSKDGVVVIVALTSDKKVILLRQYRPAANRWIVNLPGGRIDEGSIAEQSAKKELEDETGYFAERLERIYESFSNPTRVKDKTIIFLARDVQSGKKPELESAEEGREILIEDFDEVIDFLKDGKLSLTTKIESTDIFDITTITALLLVKEKLK